MERTLREIVGERVLLLRRRKGLNKPELAQETAWCQTLNGSECTHVDDHGEGECPGTALGTSIDYCRTVGRSWQEVRLSHGLALVAT